MNQNLLIVEQPDGAQVVWRPAARRHQRRVGGHGAHVKQDVKDPEGPELEGGARDDGQGRRVPSGAHQLRQGEHSGNVSEGDRAVPAQSGL